MQIKYINATARIDAMSMLRCFDVDDKKFVIRSSVTGSIIAETSFNPKEKPKICNIGDKIVQISNNNPATPTEFLIRTLLAKIKSKPSERYPPKIGT